MNPGRPTALLRRLHSDLLFDILDPGTGPEWFSTPHKAPERVQLTAGLRSVHSM